MPFKKSGAIISYLLSTYDEEHIISFPASSSIADQAHLAQWLAFQLTFQGPVLSNAFYFTSVAPNQAARDRFVAEFLRVLGVLDQTLSKRDGEHKWLVGDKCSAADLVFVAYFQNLRVRLARSFFLF